MKAAGQSWTMRPPAVVPPHRRAPMPREAVEAIESAPFAVPDSHPRRAPESEGRVLLCVVEAVTPPGSPLLDDAAPGLPG